jgi:hypothetical protein
VDDLAAALELARRDPRRQVGRFLLLGELGRGGMGVVYRAWDPAAERAVALKLLLDHDPEAIARFRREGDAVARLQHPGIVRVHEQGQVGARPFLVMELASGRPLDETPAPLPLAEAVALTRALCDALAHAHQRGVVHRDLKPANVLVDADGAPRILDFGLAKLLDRSHLTRSGTLLGTAAYMAPEQLDGRADERSDVYSLGATLYWLLTGRAPFTGGSVQNVLLAVSQRAVEPPSRSNPAVTPEVEGVLLRCLEKDPAARYPSASAFGEALARALGGARVEPARRTPTIVPLAGIALVLAAGGWALSRRGASAGTGTKTEAAPDASDPDPDAALADATQALARGDPGAALAAVTSARSAGAAAKVQRRAAALEGEARWLLGELDLAALRRASDAEGMELLDALGGATRTQASLTERRAPARPAAAFARTIELGRAGLEAEAADALALAGGADATRLAAGLLAADHAAAVRWLLPSVDAGRLEPAAAAALAREALAQLERAPQGARALARAARAAGLGPEHGVMADLRSRALARTAALSDEALTTGEAAKTPVACYRRALPPFRVALVVDPAVAPPGTLVTLVQQIYRTTPDDLEVRECAAQSEGAKRAALDPAASLTMDEALARLAELRDRALSPSSRREVVYVASELLTHAGRAQEACDWLAAAAEGGLGHEDHDFVVQWARVLHAALEPERRAQSITLLDRVIDDDPLHGDARELRGRLLLDTGGDLEQASRDLHQAVHDYQRGRDSLQHPHRDPHGLLAAVEEARGDLDAAWAACLRVRTGLQDGAWITEVRERIRAKLEARRDAR